MQSIKVEDIDMNMLTPEQVEHTWYARMQYMVDKNKWSRRQWAIRYYPKVTIYEEDKEDVFPRRAAILAACALGYLCVQAVRHYLTH